MNNEGYGFSHKNEETGTLGNVAKNIGGIVSGAGSYLSAGLSYIKIGSG